MVRQALALALLFWAGPAAACRLALVLALDVSSSVDAAEDRLQREGLAGALISPDVMAAILSDPPVALAVYEWSGRDQQAMMLGWRMLGNRAQVLAAAKEIARSERRHDRFPTAIGPAVGYAAALFRQMPGCAARVLDISGDGIGNDSYPPATAYREFPMQNVRVNGLVIGGAAEVVDWYRAEVIRGPGAFVEQASDYSDFQRAMRRKLLRELDLPALGGMPAPRADRRGG